MPCAAPCAAPASCRSCCPRRRRNPRCASVARRAAPALAPRPVFPPASAARSLAAGLGGRAPDRSSLVSYTWNLGRRSPRRRLAAQPQRFTLAVARDDRGEDVELPAEWHLLEAGAVHAHQQPRAGAVAYESDQLRVGREVEHA